MWRAFLAEKIKAYVMLYYPHSCSGSLLDEIALYLLYILQILSTVYIFFGERSQGDPAGLFLSTFFVSSEFIGNLCFL